MRTLIIYDSVYGNTEKIANAIVQACQSEVRQSADEGWREGGQNDFLIIKGVYAVYFLGFILLIISVIIIFN